MPKPSIPSINPPGTVDLEIKDAQVIFKTVWSNLEEEIGHDNLRFPKELILLGGAPGSGCLLYTSPSPRDGLLSRMPSSA